MNSENDFKKLYFLPLFSYVMNLVFKKKKKKFTGHKVPLLKKFSKTFALQNTISVKTLQDKNLLVPPLGPVSVREGCGNSILLCRVATAMSFLLWMQSFVTSSSAFTSSAVLRLTAAPGSKLNT